MRKIRMQAGVDIWLCGVCHEWQLVGRKCKCGRTNADELCEKAKEEKPNVKTEQPRRKTREPKSEGEFTKSYFFPKKGGEK